MTKGVIGMGPARLPVASMCASTASIIGDVDVFAVADDVVVAGPVKHPHSLGGGAALADEVDDSLRTVATG